MKTFAAGLMAAALAARGFASEAESVLAAASAKFAAGAYDEAIEAFERSAALHHDLPYSKMMVARCHARKGDAAKAISALRVAAEREFLNAALLEQHADFAKVREHPDYADVLAEIKKNAKPCPARAHRRRFDFWIGEWNVTGPGGKQAGSNRIDKSEDGCLLLENWTAASGGTGKSVNFYDRHTGLWRQVWVDSNGGNLDLTGDFEGESLVFKQVSSKGGNRVTFTLTFTPLPEGKVRQQGRQSTDDGKSWTTLYDLTYTRK